MSTKKLFLKYASLSMISMIGMSCYVLADTLFIANGVGPLGLTSLNLVLPVYNIIFGLGLLLGVGGATRFSILKSQGNVGEVHSYYTLAILLGLFISIPFIIVGCFFPEIIVTLMGGNQEVMEMASLYLRTFSIFTPFFILNYIIVTFVRNDHNPTLASVAMLSGTIFNIIFDYILIFPCHLGMFGAALATGCSPIISISICCFHFIQKKNHFHFIKPKLNFQHIRQIISIGIPSFVTELSSGVITFVFNMVILNIGGNIAVASYGIICNLAIVVISLFTGIGQGVQPLMSQSYGRHDEQSIHIYLRYALLTSLILACFIYMIIYLNPNSIISFFNNENNQMMAMIAKTGLILYFIGFFFAGFNIIFVSYFSSIEKVKQSFFLSLLRGGVVIIPLVIILSSLFQMNGVWLSFPISECFVFLVAICLYIHSFHGS